MTEESRIRWDEIQKILERMPIEELANRSGIQADTIRKYQYQKVSDLALKSMRNAAEVYERDKERVGNARMDKPRPGTMKEVGVKYIVDEELQAMNIILDVMRGLSPELRKRVMEWVNRKLAEEQTNEGEEGDGKSKIESSVTLHPEK